MTSAPTAEQAIGEARGPRSAAPSPAGSAGTASGSDQRAEESPEQVDPLSSAVPEEEVERRAAAEQPPAQAEGADRSIQPPLTEAERQAGAPSSPRGPESAAAVQPAPPPTPPAAPQTAPSTAQDVPEPPASERAAAATAPHGGSGDEQHAPPDQAAGRDAVSEMPETRAPTIEAPPQPSPAQPAPASAGRAEPEPPATQSRLDATAALAEPAPAERATESAPRPGTALPSRAPQAGPGKPADDETARSRGTEPQTHETPPATARAAESLRRALATLFGGAADQEAPPAGEDAEVAALPESAPAASAPGRGSGPGDPEAGPPPSFDIVRISPGGGAVIAGRAAPGADVEIRSGDRMIDRVRADRRGEWVAVPPEPLAAGVQELTLAAQVAGRSPVASEEVVVVAIPDPPDPPPPDLALPGVDVGPPRLAAAPADEDAFAVALPRKGGGKGRILQAPGRIGSEGALALEMLDYDDAGRIRLSGEASAGAALRIYVDNEPAGTTVVGPAGRWDTVLEPTLAPGDYTLRLDQLSASGEPDARIETPFTRVSQPPVAGEMQVDYVIVQPGNSLWRIARRVLGEGLHYVHIYEANQTHIRDPDLIYPGQVFEVPRAVGAAG